MSKIQEYKLTKDVLRMALLGKYWSQSGRTDNEQIGAIQYYARLYDDDSRKLASFETEADEKIGEVSREALQSYIKTGELVVREAIKLALGDSASKIIEGIAYLNKDKQRPTDQNKKVLARMLETFVSIEQEADEGKRSERMGKYKARLAELNDKANEAEQDPDTREIIKQLSKTVEESLNFTGFLLTPGEHVDPMVGIQKSESQEKVDSTPAAHADDDKDDDAEDDRRALELATRAQQEALNAINAEETVPVQKNKWSVRLNLKTNGIQLIRKNASLKENSAFAKFKISGIKLIS